MKGSSLAVFLLVVLACSSRATPADLAALEGAQEAFAGSFELDPRRDIYIEARYLLGGCPSEGEAIPLYEALLMKPSGNARRDDSSFTYLNLWNDSGDFCYQLAYDPSTQQIERSDQAYY